MTKRKRTNYSDDFKREAIKLVNEQGYKISEAAKNLGVHESVLRRWVKETGTVALAPGSQEDLHKELRRLKRENKRLRMEREILKNAAVNSIGQRNTFPQHFRRN